MCKELDGLPRQVCVKILDARVQVLRRTHVGCHGN